MLGKVMKYEFKATGRLLLPGLGMSVILTVFFKGLMVVIPHLWEPAAIFVNALAGGLAVLMMAAIMLIGFGVTLARFYQSMMTNEAYQTFALPVKASTHILGRFYVASLYLLLCFLSATFTGIVIIPGLVDYFSRFSLLDAQGNLTTFTLAQLPSSLILSAIGLLVFFVVLAIVTNLFKFYAAFALGTRIGPNRPAGSIIGYVILNIVEGILMLPFLLVPFILLFGVNSLDFDRYMNSMVSSDPVASFSNMLGFMWVMIGVVGAFTLLCTVAHYIITHYYFGKQLNIE